MGSSPPRISLAQRRARLATRHRVAPGCLAPDVGSAARSLIGLHSTDPASVYLSAWARVRDLKHAHVDEALYTERTVVKHLAMRRTVWALATGLLPIVQVAASDKIAVTERRRLARDLERTGVTHDGPAWIRKAERAALAALGRLGPTFGRDLSNEVPMLRTKITVGSKANAQQIGVVTRICTILSASGQVTRAEAGGAWHGRQPRWVRIVDWVPGFAESEPLTASAARAELARLWLYAFGPATFADLKWWTGWSVADTRAALSDLGVVEVELDGGDEGIGKGLLSADDTDKVASSGPWVALLPSLDPTTMGWKDRAWYLGSHRPRLFDAYGNAGPTIWSDGRVVGGWGQRPDGHVVLHFLEDVGSDVVAEAERQSGQLTSWLGGVQVRPSFPTPLQRELSG